MELKMIPGVFFSCTESGPSLRLPIPPLASGTVSFTTKVGRHGTPFDCVLGMRDARDKLVGGVIVRADNHRIILDLGAGNDAKSDTFGRWFLTGDVVDWVIVVGSGINVIAKMNPSTMNGTGQIKHAAGTRGNGSPVTRLDFSIPKTADGAYYPCFDWVFSDLVVADDGGSNVPPIPPPIVQPTVIPSPIEIRQVLSYLIQVYSSPTPADNGSTAPA